MAARLIILLLAFPLLTGCGLADSWFGDSDGDPLPGERIAIMGLGRGLEADRSIQDLAVRLPASRVNQAWTQTGGGPSHAMSHLALGEAAKILWRADIGSGSGDDRKILAQPLVVDDRVYTMDARSKVSAFDTERGRQVWRVDLATSDERAGFFGGGIAYESGRIFVTTGFTMVFALDAADGTTLWSQKLPSAMRAAPAVKDGRVFAVTIDNQVFALSAQTGERLWDHSGIEESAMLLGGASPAVAGSAVIVPYSSGEVFSLLAENGRVLWGDGLSAVNRIDPIADLPHIRGEPVIDRNLVLAVSHSGRTVAIDLRRGARAWDIDLGGVQMPWVAGEFVFLVTTNAQLVCVTRRDGRIRWVQNLPEYEDPEDLEDPIQWFGPVLAGDRLVVAGSNDFVKWVSPYTGEELGTFELPSSPAVAPVVAQDTLYFVTDNADLIAMR